jgi:hypothetical protein
VSFYCGQSVRHKVSGRKGKIVMGLNGKWWQVVVDGGSEQWHEDRFERDPDEVRESGSCSLVYCVPCHCHYSGPCPEHGV